MSPLPRRPGPRPATTSEIPHRQLDQQPADAAHLHGVLEHARSWPGVAEGPSGVSVPGARALLLRDGLPTGPGTAFMVGREFCHGHAQGDASLHLALPPELALTAEEAGWVEPHFLAATGEVPPTVVMLYAPRDADEAAVVLDLVRASHAFACGTHVPA